LRRGFKEEEKMQAQVEVQDQVRPGVEEVTEGMEKLKVAAINNNNAVSNENYKKNRIQVSNTKKPLFFYVNLAKRYLQQHDEVELSALGMAIATVVTVAEILKNNGLAIEKRILTSTVEMKDETRERPIQKAKVEIILTKADKFDELMAAASEERELGGDEDGHH
jgi:DNA-binding protein